jgi:hypothetical protein
MQGSGLQLTIEKLVYDRDGLTRGPAGEQRAGIGAFGRKHTLTDGNKITVNDWIKG